MPWLQTVAYGLILLSALSLWLAPQHFWRFPLGLSLLVALWAGTLEAHALLPLALLSGALFYTTRPSIPGALRSIAGACIFLCSLPLLWHRFPGFHNLKLLNDVYISPDSVPFTLYFNYDSTLVGILILGLGHPLITRRADWLPLCKSVLPRAALLISLILILALGSGFLHFDPKLPRCSPLFLTLNLLCTCLSEEAFFQGLIQRHLAQLLGRYGRFGSGAALALASLLFGLAHYAGGPSYMALAGLAGLGYGWIYRHTGRIEGSILAHFSLNLIHFFFFSYPFLALPSP